MSEATSEILLFQVGARTFASVVHDAVRVGSVRDLPASSLVLDSALGVPRARERGIVVAGEGDGELALVVDEVIGVRSVPDDQVQPLPAFAAACLASAAVTGFVMMDEAPMLLVDLPTVVRERRGAPPRDPTDPERP